MVGSSSFWCVRVEAWLPRSAAFDPQRPAVGELSYGALLAVARAGGSELRAAGVTSGDRVVIRIAPGEAFAAALHACLLLGAVAAPVDLRLGADETARQSEGSRVVLDEPRVRAWIADLSADPAAGEPRTGAGSETHDLQATAIVVHTSGTSAQPKPVELTYGNWLWSALGSAAALGVDPAERWLCCLPLSHVGGLSILLRSAIYGTSAIVHDRFDSERVLGALGESAGPTLVSLVPTTLTRLLDDGLRDPPALRWALLGGASIPDALVERAAQAGVPVASTYGMTEACSQVATLGRSLFCTRVRTAPDGELLVNGPTVAPASGPWLATGDIGSIDAGGAISVHARKSDTIITGGENVAPQEVEAVLCAHHAVVEAAVYGRADREWGEALAAQVVLRPGADATSAELRAFCADRLAGFKVPKEISFVAELPRTGSGKVARDRLKGST